MTNSDRTEHDDPAVALIAHDAKKDDMVQLASEHVMPLARMRLLGTGTTGSILSDQLGLQVDRSASGPHGGDLQIAAKIATGEVDAVVFLRDPLTAHPHEPDIQALLKVCDIYDVPVATNVAAARILLEHLGTPATAERRIRGLSATTRLRRRPRLDHRASQQQRRDRDELTAQDHAVHVDRGPPIHLVALDHERPGGLGVHTEAAAGPRPFALGLLPCRPRRRLARVPPGSP